jgi:hypothetical protein
MAGISGRTGHPRINKLAGAVRCMPLLSTLLVKSLFVELTQTLVHIFAKVLSL